MRTQRFGIEIEMTGITRAMAARIIAGYFGTQAAYTECCFEHLDGVKISAESK